MFPKTSKTSPVSLAFFHCLTFSLVLWVLTSTFAAFPMFPKMFRCLAHSNNCSIFFPYRGPNDQTKTNLTCTRRFRWIAGSTSNDSIRRLGIPGEKSGLKYPQPLQCLLFMNQVNILKDKILSKMKKFYSQFS